MKNPIKQPNPFFKICSKNGQAAPIPILLLISVFIAIGLNATRISTQHFFIFFLCLFVFALAFFRTDFAIVLLIFSMLLSPELKVGQLAERAVVIRIDDIFIFVIFCGWLAKLAVFKELAIFQKTPLNGPILIYIFLCLVSTTLMLLGGTGSLKHSFFYLLKYFEYFIIYYLVVHNLKDMRQVKIFIFFMIATCFVTAFYGLYSYFASGVRASAPFEGAIGEANTLGGYLVLLMAVMLGLLLYSNSIAIRAGLIAVLSVSGLTLLFTLSRSGWLSFCVMYLVFVAFAKRFRPQLIFAFLILTCLMLFFVPDTVRHRFESTFERQRGKSYQVLGYSVALDKSGQARINTWEWGMKYFLESPILGHGIPVKYVMDNQYVRVLTEIGLLGFLSFLFILFRLFVVLRNNIILTQRDDFSQGFYIGFLSGFAGLLVHSFSAATFIIIRIMEPFWFFAAVAVCLPEIVSASSRQQIAQDGT